MSIEATAWALNQPVKDPVAKLVLIGIANHANRDGTEAWPSQAVLAEYACVTRQTVNVKVKLLADEGYLTVTHRSTPGGRTSNSYALAMIPKSEIPTPAKSDPKSGGADTNRPIEPSSTSSETTSPQTPEAPQKPRAPDVLWDVFEEEFGSVTNDGSRGRRNRALKLIRQSLEAEHPDVDVNGLAGAAILRERIETARERWNGVGDFSEMAIAGAWDRLGRMKEGEFDLPYGDDVF
jgi:Helix-turn-helix domain